MNRVFLSRRNLHTLMSKLDRKLNGEDTQCTIIKRDTLHPVYPQTMKEIEIVAIEDQEYYYKTGKRIPGQVHPSDE